MSELLFLHKRSSLSTLAGTAEAWKHEKAFKYFAYYLVFAHANDFTSGSLCCVLVFYSVKHLNKNPVVTCRVGRGLIIHVLLIQYEIHSLCRGLKKQEILKFVPKSCLNPWSPFPSWKVLLRARNVLCLLASWLRAADSLKPKLWFFCQ